MHGVSTPEVESFREWARRYDWRQPGLAELAERPNVELQAAIDGAKAWIDGRRWSWNIVAANFLLDGRYHASLAR